MLFQDQPLTRRLLLVGTPLLTGIMLLFHPRVEPAEMGEAYEQGGLLLFSLLAPVAGRFLAIHAVFALAIALLGLAVVLLQNGLHGIDAAISRVSAFVFVVTYTLYETIVGTAPALLVRGAEAAPPAEQTAIGNAVLRLLKDPLFGDGPSLLSGIAWLAWPAAVILAAIALRRAGRPLSGCILLGLSSVFTLHASPLGPLGLFVFALAAWRIERRRPETAEVEHKSDPLPASRAGQQPQASADEARP